MEGNNKEGDFCFSDDRCASNLKCWCGTCQNIDNPTRDNIACEVKGLEYDYVNQRCTSKLSEIDCRAGMVDSSAKNSTANSTSQIPWLWIIGGSTIAFSAIGGGIWWYMSQSGKSSGVLGEPVPHKYNNAKFKEGDKIKIVYDLGEDYGHFFGETGEVILVGPKEPKGRRYLVSVGPYDIHVFEQDMKKVK